MDQFGLQVGQDRADAFEGWFVKIDDPASGFLCSVIWGYATAAAEPHAFIQFTHNRAPTTRYLKFSLEKTWLGGDRYVMQMGPNRLGRHHMVLNLPEGVTPDEPPVRMDVTLGPWQTIRQTRLRPNIMGLLSFFPNECNHSITSMHHTVDGTVALGRETLTLAGANGYLEKDWGTDFPTRYVWAQANRADGTSMVFSHATVPMLGRAATGFFLLCQIRGAEYRFSTIEGARMRAFTADASGFRAEIRKVGGLTAELTARPFSPIALRAPRAGAMAHAIKESLDGHLELRLTHTRRSEVAHTFVTDRASMDLHWETAP